MSGISPDMDISKIQVNNLLIHESFNKIIKVLFCIEQLLVPCDFKISLLCDTIKHLYWVSHRA